MRETTQPNRTALGAQRRASYSPPSAVCLRALRLRASLTHFSIGKWLTTRTSVREPTAASQPLVGALLNRHTSVCASISAPRGWRRRRSELPTTAHFAASSAGTLREPRRSFMTTGRQLGRVDMTSGGIIDGSDENQPAEGAL